MPAVAAPRIRRLPTQAKSVDERNQWSRVVSLIDRGWVTCMYDRLSSLGSAVQPSALRAAHFFLSNADGSSLPEPLIAALPDGGIGFHWRVHDRDLEIEATAEGQLLFLKTPVGNLSGMVDGEVFLDNAQNILDWVTGR